MSDPNSNKQVVHVVGSGLVGPLAAIFLARKGYDVELYERRADMRKGNIAAGRSINLVVTDRGLKALETVGLKERVMEIAIPMKGRMLHDVKGEQTFVPYGQNEGEVINAISRGLLNCLLMDAAEEYENLNIHFNHHCTGYDPEDRMLHFHIPGGTGKQIIHAETVIGADGAWSAVRKAMQENVMNFNYAQDFLEHAYKELVIPPANDGGFHIARDALHIWPRNNFMLIALPNVDGSFTCTLFLPYHGEESFDMLQTETDVANFFAKHFPDAVSLMPTLIEDFFENPTGALATIRCNPWNIDDKALVIGDAAHAIVPFFGQGMNCGFEDCTVLGELLDEGGRDWDALFTELGRRRKPNSEAIADMALENFLEMRETTADPKFQVKKKIGFALEKRFPQQFIPRYSMVMFHPEISYAEAKRRSEIQDGILEKLAANISSAEQINWDDAEKLVHSLKER